jgi:hypothetical protein
MSFRPALRAWREEARSLSIWMDLMQPVALAHNTLRVKRLAIACLRLNVQVARSTRVASSHHRHRLLFVSIQGLQTFVSLRLEKRERLSQAALWSKKRCQFHAFYSWRAGVAAVKTEKEAKRAEERRAAQQAAKIEAQRRIELAAKKELRPVAGEKDKLQVASEALAAALNFASAALSSSSAPAPTITTTAAVSSSSSASTGWAGPMHSRPLSNPRRHSDGNNASESANSYTSNFLQKAARKTTSSASDSHPHLSHSFTDDSAPSSPSRLSQSSKGNPPQPGLKRSVGLLGSSPSFPHHPASTTMVHPAKAPSVQKPNPLLKLSPTTSSWLKANSSRTPFPSSQSILTNHTHSPKHKSNQDIFHSEASVEPSLLSKISDHALSSIPVASTSTLGATSLREVRQIYAVTLIPVL